MVHMRCASVDDCVDKSVTSQCAFAHVCCLQEEFLEEYKLPIAACKTFSMQNVSSASSDDYYSDEFQSIYNLLCQLNSLQEVTSMWRSSGHEYHAVMYMRPDILYNCPFPTSALDNLEAGTVHIADFHHWNGFNDRFAMGQPGTVALWGDRCGPTHKPWAQALRPLPCPYVPHA